MDRPRYDLHRDNGLIVLDGDIGPRNVSANALRRSLRELESEPVLNVLVDSRGGSCAEGMAIYLTLREQPKPVHVTVRRAGSMASVVAMAGHRIDIERGGEFHLHQSRTDRECFIAVSMAASPIATASAMRSMASALDALDELHTSIYARRTKLSREALGQLLAAETTLDAETAVRMGFADGIIEP